MNGIWILLFLILAAALPVIIVFFWLRTRKPALTPLWFLVSLAAGVISLLAAALIQGLFPPSGWKGQDGPGMVFFYVFIRIALVEEASRLFTIIPILKAIDLLPIAENRRRYIDMAFGASLGFVVGLGFATLESAIYGIADINITLIRAFTASPLHGACGIRAGTAVFSFRQYPAKAAFLFISAVLFHGVYNLIIDSPFIPSVLAVLVAFAALFASLHWISGESAQ